MHHALRCTALALLCANPHAHAACSRPIVVPVSNIGLAVKVEGDTVSGVYPDVLRALGEKAGCTFVFPSYPRARSDQMFFETGTSDLLIPASFVPERAEVARFVPLIKVLPTAISLKPLAVPLHSVQQLLDAKALRVVVVRSYTFGTAYQDLIAALEKMGRVDYAPDMATVARMLLAGRVDLTIMPLHILQAPMDAAAGENATTAVLLSHPLQGLARIQSGVYISRRSLTDADQAALQQMFAAAVKADSFVKGHQRYYPSKLLKGVVTRP